MKLVLNARRSSTRPHSTRNPPPLSHLHPARVNQQQEEQQAGLLDNFREGERSISTWTRRCRGVGVGVLVKLGGDREKRSGGRRER